MSSVNDLLHTSVDDCRTSLNFVTDLELLEKVLKQCQILPGHKSRGKAVATRIRQLKKAAAQK